MDVGYASEKAVSCCYHCSRPIPLCHNRHLPKRLFCLLCRGQFHSASRLLLLRWRLFAVRSRKLFQFWERFPSQSKSLHCLSDGINRLNFKNISEVRQWINDLSSLITSQLASLPSDYSMGWLTSLLANHLEGRSVSLSFSEIGTSISESVGQLLKSFSRWIHDLFNYSSKGRLQTISKDRLHVTLILLRFSTISRAANYNVLINRTNMILTRCPDQGLWLWVLPMPRKLK